uniref:GTP-dependent dephospho-CoA kinase n=1 Tax=Archaeoglobus fulgidus TaxID=2234 RepID=A0A7C3R976_ARCFL
MRGIRLPESMREEFAKPHGRLYRGKGESLLLEVKEISEAKLFCTVGDLVTASAIKVGLIPNLAVADGKTLREENVEFRKDVFDEVITAKNPPAHISCELISAIIEALKECENGKRVLVFVDGEEDLAVVPLVKLLPLGAVIVYGQPGEGVVALEVDEEKKILILNLLRKMEMVGECDELRYLLGGD